MRTSGRPADQKYVPAVERQQLYTPAELFAGFDPDRVGSYADTLDFRTYLTTLGGRPSRHVGMLRALHDQCITDARDDLVDGRPVVAIMGGHDLGRDAPAYPDVVELAAGLTTAGFLVTSGGGPGAMEATHLGAAMARALPAERAAAVRELAAAAPHFPHARLVSADGTVDRDALAALHAWQAPAFRLAARLPDPAVSLAIPTWFYGHEPPTPFATHLAKYFANALREDGLLAIATDGVVYAPGRAGTLQEIFQDAAQNYYRVFHDRFSPMVFLDIDAHWSARFPVAALLGPLFEPGAHPSPDELRRTADFDANVTTTASVGTALEFLAGRRSATSR